MVSRQRKTEERGGTGFSVLAARSFTLVLLSLLRNSTETLATQAIIVSFSLVFIFINSVDLLDRPQLKGLVSKKCPSVGE